MKVFLVNKFYYRRGGDCIYTMNLEQLLKSQGHSVAVFSMQYPLNEPSEWSRYWPSNMSKLDAVVRPFGTRQVIRGFNKILDDFQPDVVHINNIHTQISPVVAEIAHARGIRVVWTLHDTKLVCPCHSCQRDGKWCTECFSDKTAVIKHRCLPGSIPGAIIGYFEMQMWNKNRLQNCTDLFITPSQFMKNTMVQGGYNPNKLNVLCNFIDINKVASPKFDKGEYYCFVGRLSTIKGIRTLCKVASELPYRLVVIGGGELLDELKDKYSSKIEFLGQKDWKEFRPILEGAKFMVLPSECSENNPLTVIEAQSLGTPTLGARIGGIPELISEGVNGMTFESGNPDDLKVKIEKMWRASFDYPTIAKEAVARYSDKAYLEKHLTIYKG